MCCGIVSSFERIYVVFFQTIRFAFKKGKNLLIACISKIKAVERLIKRHLNGNRQTVRFKLRISQNKQ